MAFLEVLKEVLTRGQVATLTQKFAVMNSKEQVLNLNAAKEGNVKWDNVLSPKTAIINITTKAKILTSLVNLLDDEQLDILGVTKPEDVYAKANEILSMAKSKIGDFRLVDSETIEKDFSAREPASYHSSIEKSAEGEKSGVGFGKMGSDSD